MATKHPAPASGRPPPQGAAWRRLPRYTAAGYKLERLPPELRARLLAAHLDSTPRPEAPNPHLAGQVFLADLPRPLERDLERHVRARLQEWTGAQLDFVNSYGPRSYTRGATLAPHGDKFETHALSAIVFVEALDAAPWPLQFVPVGAEEVLDVFLGAHADLLLYESTQPHGRVEPLQGRAYTALFMHWCPHEWPGLARDLQRDLQR